MALSKGYQQRTESAAANLHTFLCEATKPDGRPTSLACHQALRAARDDIQIMMKWIEQSWQKGSHE